ncbi:hypothetical protein Tco_0400794 [Tanacetum coccineum]
MVSYVGETGYGHMGVGLGFCHGVKWGSSDSPCGVEVWGFGRNDPSGCLLQLHGQSLGTNGGEYHDDKMDVRKSGLVRPLALLVDEVEKIVTAVTKNRVVTRYPGKFHEYQLTEKEKEFERMMIYWVQVEYEVSDDDDSDLKSTARSVPKDYELVDTGSSNGN